MTQFLSMIFENISLEEIEYKKSSLIVVLTICLVRHNMAQGSDETEVLMNMKWVQKNNIKYS